MTINCKGKLIDLSEPKIMGILNLTPDSFYDGGKYKNDKDILLHVERMLTEGATFIDVGAYSSRPGADAVSDTEEMDRIVPIVDLILTRFPETLLSIDTFRSTVATACLESGAAMVNDISAGQLDGNMIQAIAPYKVPYIMMHMRGNPKNMQDQTQYNDLLQDMLYYFSERIKMAVSHGLTDIVLDPGFGFAKTLEQNYLLLKKLQLLTLSERPLLVGVSRKSMIYKILGTTPKNALNGTTALHMTALANGANILRVHDVQQAQECILLFEQLKAAKG